MTFQNFFAELINRAKDQNKTAKIVSMYAINAIGARKTALRDYLMSRAQFVPQGTQEMAAAAGNSILEELKNKNETLENLMQQDPQNLNTKWRSFKFYNLLSEYPIAMAAALIIAIDSVSNAQGQGIQALLDTAGAASTGNVSGVVKGGAQAIKTAASDLKKLFASKGPTQNVDIYYFWKWGNNQPNAGQPAKTEPMSKQYFENNYRPQVEAGSKQYGLTYEDIAAVWPMYAPTFAALNRQYPGDSVWPELFKRIKADYTALAKNQPEANLPEIGKVQTPWGNISWGVTNNKAVIIGLVVAAVALIGIFYVTRKK